MTSLAAYRADIEQTESGLVAALHAYDPAINKWDWYRAEQAIAWNGSKNPEHIKLASDPGICEAHRAYIDALHAFYEARDGMGGFLGSRGL